jgi:hypothetical protein
MSGITVGKRLRLSQNIEGTKSTVIPAPLVQPKTVKVAESAIEKINTDRDTGLGAPPVQKTKNQRVASKIWKGLKESAKSFVKRSIKWIKENPEDAKLYLKTAIDIFKYIFSGTPDSPKPVKEVNDLVLRSELGSKLAAIRIYTPSTSGSYDDFLLQVVHTCFSVYWHQWSELDDATSEQTYQSMRDVMANKSTLKEKVDVCVQQYRRWAPEVWLSKDGSGKEKIDLILHALQSIQKANKDL